MVGLFSLREKAPTKKRGNEIVEKLWHQPCEIYARGSEDVPAAMGIAALQTFPGKKYITTKTFTNKRDSIFSTYSNSNHNIVDLSFSQIYGPCFSLMKINEKYFTNKRRIIYFIVKTLRIVSPMFSIFANLCRSAGFFLQGSAKIVALNLEDSYRSARSLQKCADFLEDFCRNMFFCSF